MTARFIGIEGIISDVKLTRFGEKVELPLEAIAEAIAGNFPIIPNEDFENCGFTAEELDAYAYPGPRSECSPEFAEKWKAARIALHEIRQKLQDGGRMAAGGE